MKIMKNFLAAFMCAVIGFGAGLNANADDASSYLYGMAVDGCMPGTNGEPRFSTYHLLSEIEILGPSYSHYESHEEWSSLPDFVHRGTNYYISVTTDGTLTGNVADDAYDLSHIWECEGTYGAHQDGGTRSISLAQMINDYLIYDFSPENTEIIEQHDGSSFSVSATFSSAGETATWRVTMSYDGALEPTKNLNQGKDNGDCTNQCGNCESPGMPSWHISQPYMNLWVHDTPVFYKTSLGQKVAFHLNYKQRDTRPKDDGKYPITGWNHNWYSYIRLNVPVYSILLETNVGSVRTSKRGIDIPANYALTNDYTKWEAILYAPDNSESYFAYNETSDSSRGYSIHPVWSGDSISGFRLIHGDGSQDVYWLVGGMYTNVYGITRRYGAVYEKPDSILGSQAVWRSQLIHGGRASWQSEDDAATYADHADHGRPNNWNKPTIQEAAVVEYLAGDALLTARLDPYGNAINLSYTNKNGRFYLSSIVDYDGNTTSLTYNSNNLLETVTMPYGRTATLLYSGIGYPSLIVDAAGMGSSIDYVTSETENPNLFPAISSITTPYGTTSFEYEDGVPFKEVYYPPYKTVIAGSGGATAVQADSRTAFVYVGEANVHHKILVTHPDSSQEVYLYWPHETEDRFSGILSPSESMITAGQGLLNYGQAGGESAVHYRNCFHWGRSHTPHLSGVNVNDLTAADFRLARWQHYPEYYNWELPGNAEMSPMPAFEREGSPDGINPGRTTWFTYPDYQSSDGKIISDPQRITQIVEAPDGTPIVTSLNYDSWGNLTTLTKTFTQEDGTTSLRNWYWNYQYIPVDIGNYQTVYMVFPWGVTEPSGRSITFNTPGITMVNGFPILDWPIITITDSENRVTTNYFNSRHQLTGIGYANGTTLTNLYTTSGFLRRSILLEAQATNGFTFDKGELASQTTPLGLTVYHTHDALGRRTGSSFPDGTTISNIYERLNLKATKDRMGVWTQRTYDNMGQLRSVSAPDQGTTSYTYCLCGGLESQTDPMGVATTYIRDYNGRVTSIVSPEGTTSLSRDSLGRVTNAYAPYGLNLSLSYNLQGLVTNASTPAGRLFSAVYDYGDRRIIETDAQGYSITNSFDTLNRVLYRWNAFGLAEQNIYSVLGLERSFDARGKYTDYGYDAAGRLGSVTNANLEVTSFGYDPVGNLTRLTDGRGKTKRWSYDMYGREFRETNANGVLVSQYGYDANGRLTTKWTAAKSTTTYQYDAAGNLRFSLHPTGNITYTYNLLGQMTGMTDPVGTTVFTYKGLAAFRSVLESEDGPWANDTVTYGYTGPRLDSITLGSWIQSFTYDAGLRPDVITSPAVTFDYVFNGGGTQPASLSMPGGTASWAYDEAGRLLETAFKTGQTARDRFNYDRDISGLITNLHRLNGVTEQFGYDEIGQLTSAQAFEGTGALRKLENLAYGYDAAGNLAFRTNNTLIQTFVSGNRNELTSITRSGTLTVAGSLDGQVTSLYVGTNQAQIYSDNSFATVEGIPLRDGYNQFVTAGTNAGVLVVSTITTNWLPVTSAFSYDLNGNLLSDSQKTFEYDRANQLTSVTLPGTWKTEYAYDGLGRRRITREYTWGNGWALANESRYVYDRMLVLQERKSDNTTLATYTRGLDLSGSMQGAGGIGGLLARTDHSTFNPQPSTSFFHADGNGNISTLTDSSGAVVARYLYDPFGRVLGKWGPMADVNRYQFSSKETDNLTGLSYYGYRFYDPNLQRWLNEDPILEAGGINLYGFVGNNPIGFIDPLGLHWADWSFFQWWEKVTRPLRGLNPDGSEERPRDSGMKGPQDDTMGLQPSFLGELLLPGGGLYMSGAGTSRCAAKAFAEAAARRKAAELAEALARRDAAGTAASLAKELLDQANAAYRQAMQDLEYAGRAAGTDSAAYQQALAAWRAAQSKAASAARNYEQASLNWTEANTSALKAGR
jgi:RHS repeat-associated protein